MTPEQKKELIESLKGYKNIISGRRYYFELNIGKIVTEIRKLTDKSITALESDSDDRKTSNGLLATH